MSDQIVDIELMRNVANEGRGARMTAQLHLAADEIERLRQQVAELESDDNTIQAVIGRVEVRGCYWEIALAPDCQTWLTVPMAGCAKRPEIGDIVTIRDDPKAACVEG